MITRDEASHIYRNWGKLTSLELVGKYQQAFETILSLYERIEELEDQAHGYEAILVSNGIAVENEG